MEMSLNIDTPEGIVPLVGYSHTTREKNFAEATLGLGNPICQILGGAHLFTQDPKEASRIAGSLRDRWKGAWIGPAYSATEPAFRDLHRSSGDRYLDVGLGSTLRLGPEIDVKVKAYLCSKHATEGWRWNRGYRHAGRR